MKRQLGWLTAAAALGFAIPAVFSSLIGLERDVYLLVYLPVTGAFCLAFLAQAAPPAWTDPMDRWGTATAVGTAAGMLLVLSVLRQPPGAHGRGMAFVVDLAWSGVAYGVVDTLLLTILPVAAVFGAFGYGERSRAGTLAVAGIALAASLAVTAVYHLGYEEFRGAALAGPLVGNAIISLAYLLARNPIAPGLAHVAMHVAAVVHGMETAVQLPPHG